MKRIIIIIIAIFGLGAINANAQSNLKFAHVDYVKVIDSLPSKMSADKEINTFLTNGQKTLEEMQISFEEEYQKYLSEKDSLSSLMQEIREKNLMEQQQLIQYKSESLENDLQIFNDRLYKPIEKSFNTAVKNIALKYKINYILEVNSILYVDGGLDLTKEVKAEVIRLEGIRTAK